MSEAVEAVGRLIAAFPNGSPPNAKGYIGALASVLLDYPRSVSMRCADPKSGVARETRFLPTVADLVAWCEHETAAVRTPVEREDRDAAILRAMEKRRIEGELWDEQRKSRPSYDELKAAHGPNWGMSEWEADRSARQYNAEQLARGNELAIQRAHAAAGTTPAHPLAASPMLAARIAEQDATRAAIPNRKDSTLAADLDDEIPF